MVIIHKMLVFPFLTLEQPTTFQESIINRLSNLIHRNRPAAKISQVLCSSLYCVALHWCDDNSNSLILLVLDIEMAKALISWFLFLGCLFLYGFRYKDGDRSGFFSCFQRPHLPGHSTRWLGFLKKQSIWYLRHMTRCQIWCTIEVHRDPISKVLLEW